MKLTSTSCILALVALLSAFASNGLCAPVTFWFTGYITIVNDPSNAMPFAVSIGTPFAGRVEYDPTRVAYSSVSTSPSGNVGNYYFDTTNGYSTFLELAGHSIRSDAQTGPNSAYVGIDNRSDNGDIFMSDTGGVNMWVDGHTFVSGLEYSMLSLFLGDNSKTAYNDTALPTNAPVLSKFPDAHEFAWGVFLSDGWPTRIFSVAGTLTSISTNELVLLNQRTVAPGTLQLDWAASSIGFTLQSATNLAAPDWQPVLNPIAVVNGRNTVTVSIGGGPRFFRLRKQ